MPSLCLKLVDTVFLRLVNGIVAKKVDLESQSAKLSKVEK